MATIGYHASLEQFRPSTLLRYVQLAEQAGFQAAMCSDCFYPWNEQQGQGGFAWSWLGAALFETHLPFGTVSVPGYRYHPATLAQAVATLAEMFPERFWLAVGDGENLNEHIVGKPWPPKAKRRQQLKECVAIMRALWAGETVDYAGMVHVERAKLYTLPIQKPKILGAAFTAETAEWFADWVDGVITVYQPEDELKNVVKCFRQAGGVGKPLFLYLPLSYHQDEKIAQQEAYDQWATNILPSEVLTELSMPEQFTALKRFIRPDDLAQFIPISSSAEYHTDIIHHCIELGFEHIYLHNVNRSQAAFIDTFGEKVLPQL